MRAAEESPEKEEFDEVIVNGHKIRDLRYADDTALLSTSGAGLEKWIRAVKEQGDQYCLYLNAKKTKIMDTKAPGNQLVPTDIHIGGHKIENVDSLEYLLESTV